jgi:two-component sensor histidine kinase
MVTWRIEEGEQPKVSLDWVESGGPKISDQAASGFGSNLIRSVMQSEPGGSAKLSFVPDGVMCRLTFSAERAAESVSSH